MSISLIITLVITTLVLNTEAQKRTTMAGSDAQTSAAMGLTQIRQSLMSAGYGLNQAPGAIGCAIAATYNGAPVAGFPSALVPVSIIDGGADGAPDAIRVLASSKASFAVPVRLTGNYSGGQAEFDVATITGVEPSGGSTFGDLMLAASSGAAACEVFHVTGTSGTSRITRVEETDGWNAPGKPAGPYSEGDVLVNLGSLQDVTFSLQAGGLARQAFRLGASGAPSYVGPSVIQSDVVNLQALYGKDVDDDGAVDRWEAAAPASPGEWSQVTAIRLAIVARSAQFDREAVTAADFPEGIFWDVGTAVPVTGSLACGASRCLKVKLDGISEWKHYRYKTFETIVPLRNVIWRAT